MVKYRYEWFFDELNINDIEDTSPLKNQFRADRIITYEKQRQNPRNHKFHRSISVGGVTPPALAVVSCLL